MCARNLAVTNLHEGAKLFDELHETRVERRIIFLISNVKANKAQICQLISQITTSKYSLITN